MCFFLGVYIALSGRSELFRVGVCFDKVGGCGDIKKN
jgi:hypothetical protein